MSMGLGAMLTRRRCMYGMPRLHVAWQKAETYQKVPYGEISCYQDFCTADRFEHIRAQGTVNNRKRAIRLMESSVESRTAVSQRRETRTSLYSSGKETRWTREDSLGHRQRP